MYSRRGLHFFFHHSAPQRAARLLARKYALVSNGFGAVGWRTPLQRGRPWAFFPEGITGIFYWLNLSGLLGVSRRLLAFWDCVFESLSSRSHCDGPINRPEESYWLCVVCDREARSWPTSGLLCRSGWGVGEESLLYYFFFNINCSVHHCNCSKIITNKMTLMDYPLFQG